MTTTPTARRIKELDIDTCLQLLASHRVGRVGYVEENGEPVILPVHLDDADLLRGRRGTPLDERTVVVVDEAGMVGSRQLARLLSYAERYRSKVVLVGDDRQLPEIDAGGAFRALQVRLDAAELTENRRQRDPIQREALSALRSGRAPTGVRLLADNRQVIVGDNAEAIRDQLVNDWWNARTAGRSRVIIAGRNAGRRGPQARARARRIAAGELGGAEVDTPAGPLQVGDEVIGTRNVPVRAIDARAGRAQLVNGARGTVIAVDLSRGTVDARVEVAGVERDVRIDAQMLANGALRHGYAVTAHKAQGMTTEDVFVLGTDELYREWLYVAMSRGRRDNRLYINGGAEAVELGDDPSHPQILERGGVLHPVAGLAQMSSRSDRQQAALDQHDGRAGTPEASRPPALTLNHALRSITSPATTPRLAGRIAEAQIRAAEAAERRISAEREADAASSGLGRVTRREPLRRARAKAARAVADEQLWAARLTELQQWYEGRQRLRTTTPTSRRFGLRSPRLWSTPETHRPNPPSGVYSVRAVTLRSRRRTTACGRGNTSRRAVRCDSDLRTPRAEPNQLNKTIGDREHEKRKGLLLRHLTGSCRLSVRGQRLSPRMIARMTTGS